MGRLRRGGARRSSTIFAATMFPRLAAFTTDRTTPSTSDASNCSAKMVLLCRAPLGGPELPFANGSTARFGGVVSLVHAGDSKIDDSRSQWKNVTSASPRDDDACGDSGFGCGFNPDPLNTYQRFVSVVHCEVYSRPKENPPKVAGEAGSGGSA